PAFGRGFGPFEETSTAPGPGLAVGQDRPSLLSSGDSGRGRQDVPMVTDRETMIMTHCRTFPPLFLVAVLASVLLGLGAPVIPVGAEGALPVRADRCPRRCGTGAWSGAARVVGLLAVEARAAGAVRPVTGRIGGHRFERFVWPPGPPPADPEANRPDGGCWV